MVSLISVWDLDNHGVEMIWQKEQEGHKVVLLKQYLDQFDDDDKRCIVFSDCYDAVISCSLIW